MRNYICGSCEGLVNSLNINKAGSVVLKSFRSSSSLCEQGIFTPFSILISHLVSVLPLYFYNRNHIKNLWSSITFIIKIRDSWSPVKFRILEFHLIKSVDKVHYFPVWRYFMTEISFQHLPLPDFLSLDMKFLPWEQSTSRFRIPVLDGERDKHKSQNTTQVILDEPYKGWVKRQDVDTAAKEKLWTSKMANGDQTQTSDMRTKITYSLVTWLRTKGRRMFLGWLKAVGVTRVALVCLPGL